MSSATLVDAGVDIMPSHKNARKGEIEKAYLYVQKVANTVDYPEQRTWHGWALREAFLAGMLWERSR